MSFGRSISAWSYTDTAVLSLPPWKKASALLSEADRASGVPPRLLPEGECTGLYVLGSCSERLSGGNGEAADGPVLRGCAWADAIVGR
eukprot:CAMPEP_0119097588 /NCGR_PEP_ID=MMETSP1178-20130426/179637_1 /TAXON_ID=33656 /ORGANISM="unid sp, Strain CCMP2000" /LENGTH=87 /DNA_ID=CAMNT_0007081533 /DNA_START=33 /DNA_END=292 /DNA_ORIENTATION=-